jgi:ribonuclease HI
VKPLSVWTDASTSPEGSGLAAIFGDGTTASWFRPDVTHPYQAELMAILLALHHAPPTKLVIINTDCRALVKSKKHKFQFSPAFRRHTKVKLNWIPREQNVAADRLANAARISRMSVPIIAYVATKTAMVDNTPQLSVLTTLIPDGKTRVPQTTPADPNTDATSAQILAIHRIVTSTAPALVVVYASDPKAIAHFHRWDFELPPNRRVKFLPTELNEAAA